MLFVAGAGRLGSNPAAVGGDVVDIENAFRGDFLPVAAVCFHAIEKVRAAFYRTEDEVAVRQTAMGESSATAGEEMRTGDDRRLVGATQRFVVAALVIHGKATSFPSCDTE